ncbi:MAG: tetratricopeptide repeat protein [Tannerellaceae bacterium]|jgi:tetratricopeptide (TPR) repeat protein|nr:tetratricopeptide repeat protein [Tannerellaceae bacterium]
MKKFFTNTVTLVVEVIIFVVALGWWLSAEAGDRYEPLIAGLGSLAGIIISICYILSKDDGKGGGVMNILKASLNFNSNVIHNNGPVTISLDANKLIKEQTAEYKERIKELKKLLESNKQPHGMERSKLSAAIADLEKQLKDKEDKIQEFVKYYATVDIDINAAPLFKEAFGLFSQGKLDETLALLDEDKSKNETPKLEDKRKELAATYILKAQTLDLTNNFQDTEVNYLKAAEIFPSGENNFQVAYFYQKQNNFPAAEAYYTRCLPLAKTPEEKAKILNNVGNLYADMNDYSKAAKAYKEAEDIYRELAAINPQAYRPYVAMTLNNAGGLHWNMNDYPKAAKASEEAEDIYRELAAIDPQAYLPYVAMTLSNVGSLLEDMKDYPKAAKAYKEAEDIYRELAAINPQAYLPDLAMTLNNVGGLHWNVKDYPKAAKAFEGALQIRCELAAENPQAYRPGLAMTLSNVGSLLEDMKDYPKAAKAYEEALQILRELAAENPQAYRPDLAMTLNNVGILHRNMKDYPKAAKAYEEALQIRRELAAENPQAYRPGLAMTLANLALFYRDGVPDRERSIQYAREVLSYRSSLEGIPNAQKSMEVADQILDYWEKRGRHIFPASEEGKKYI